MPAPLSIIIPTLNAAEALPETVLSLLEGVTSGLVGELVISDGGSVDATAEIARELGASLVSGPAGRGGQIARGVSAASGEWLLILHADTHLSEDWSKSARQFMQSDPAKAGYFRLKFREEGLAPRMVSMGANVRSQLLGLPYGDQGLLIHRELLASVGGFPGLPLMEDVALARRLKGKLFAMDADARTSAERYVRDGWIRRVRRNLWTLARYLGGVPAERLVKQYDGKPQSSEN